MLTVGGQDTNTSVIVVAFQNEQ